MPEIPILPKPKVPEYMQKGDDYSIIVRWTIELLFKIEEWERWYIEYKRLIDGYNENNRGPS